VLQRLRELVGDPELVGVVELLVNRPYAGRGVSGSSRRGLLQGSALSPVLANLYLDGFDRRLLAEGFQVVRYSDDVAVPVPDRPTGERVLELAADAAADLQLRLNVEDPAVVAWSSRLSWPTGRRPWPSATASVP
jgi:CRISP-associated protein Cas1